MSRVDALAAEIFIALVAKNTWIKSPNGCPCDDCDKSRGVVETPDDNRLREWARFSIRAATVFDVEAEQL